MRNRIFYICFCLSVLLFTGCIKSPRVTPFLQIPTDSSFATVNCNLPELETAYPKTPLIYLDYNYAYEHSYISYFVFDLIDWEEHDIKKVRYVVIDPDDRQGGTIKINSYLKAKINNLYVMTKSPDGSIRRYSEKDFTKEKTEGSVKLTLLLPKLEKGMIIEVGRDISTDLYRRLPRYNFEDNVKDANAYVHYHTSFAFPDWWQLGTKRISASQGSPLRKSENKEAEKQIFTYTVDSLKSYIPEPYAPYYRENNPYYQLYIQSINSPGSVGSDEWGEIAGMFKNYVLYNDGFLSRASHLMAKEVTEKTLLDEDKILKIAKYIQKNISLASDNTSRNFSEVLDDKKGSAWEICGLTVAMLNKIGLPAELMLVHSADDGYFDPAFVSVSQFSMPAVRARAGNRYYCIVPYNRDLPVGLVPQEMYNETCLIVSKNRKEHGTFWKIPPVENYTDSAVSKKELLFGSEGQLHVKEQIAYYGMNAYSVRSALRSAEREDKNKYLESLFLPANSKAENTRFTVQYQDSLEKELILEAEYDVEDAVTITPDEVIFQTGGLLSPINLFSSKTDTTVRHNPIAIKQNTEYVQYINITFPLTWQLQTKFTDYAVQNKFGKASETVNVWGTTINMQNRGLFVKSTGDASEFKDLYKLINRDRLRNIPAIVFTQSK